MMSRDEKGYLDTTAFVQSGDGKFALGWGYPADVSVKYAREYVSTHQGRRDVPGI